MNALQNIQSSKQIAKIDSHQHFWSLARGDYHWLTAELTELYQDFLPEQLMPYMQQANVQATVLVQAAETTAETDYMLALAAEHSFIRGVVGWVNLADEQVLAQLQNFASNPIFKGIRPMLQDIDDAKWILQPQFATVFDYLIAENLTFDALVLPKHLPHIYQLACQYPQLKIVIDHAAKPQIDAIHAGDIKSSAWFYWMEKLAQLPQVYCKLSGLVTQITSPSDKVYIDNFAKALLQIFTSKKLMWGSDWPVLNLTANYQEWLSISEQVLHLLNPQQQADVCFNNAVEFYNLQLNVE